MIKHLVMFKLADVAEGNTKRENALRIKKDLEALKGVISEIVKIEVFINDDEAAKDNYDIVLVSEFENIKDLQAYAIHPEHVKVGGFIAKVRTARAAIDYQF